MSEPITQIVMDEITEYCETHPGCRVQMHEDGSWCIALSWDQKYRGWLHPRSFLDLIRDDTPTTDILKTT
jgi:hypothetical protein